MSDTLGSLIDKLSIVCLKHYHTNSPEKKASLLSQRTLLSREMDDFIRRLKLDPTSVTITFPSNKVYQSGVVTETQQTGSLGELAGNIVDANIRMWHLQEINYDRAELESMSKDEMLNYLTLAANANIERTKAIDVFDAELARQC